MGKAFQETVKVYPSNWLYQGIASNSKPTDKIQAIVVSKIDSPINCHTRLLRNAPSTLRKPTSLERSTARMVERFMKLMQAINKIKTAMERKIYTTVLLPCFTSSKSALAK